MSVGAVTVRSSLAYSGVAPPQLDQLVEDNPKMIWSVWRYSAPLHADHTGSPTQPNARPARIEARHPELRFERVGFVFVFKMPDEFRQALDRLDIKPERFAGFASGRPPTCFRSS